MHNKNFDPDDITSLPDPDHETRDHLSDLAVAIVAAKLDLAFSEYGNIISELNTTIRELHAVWKRSKCDPPNDDSFCTHCGLPKLKPSDSENHCSNPECVDYSKILHRAQRFCGKCGSPTTFIKTIEGMI